MILTMPFIKASWSSGMVAVDTNIVVRLLTQDDDEQYARSLKLFQGHDIFIPDTVLLETAWVLRGAYQFQPSVICAAFRSLLGLPNVQVTNGELAAQALQWHEEGLDFADALHLAQCQTCSVLYTFDVKLVSRANGLTQCMVQQPQ
jgi:predicted nucleic-acid-binding protein